MATCANCKTIFFLGGVTDATERFCSDRCQSQGRLLRLSTLIPPSAVQAMTEQVRHGTCPDCGGAGPVEAFVSHRVWSAVFKTQWTTHQHVCCRPCATRKQLTAMGYSALLGWWGIPWGLLITPIQILRNGFELMKRAESPHASAELVRIVRMHMAAQPE